MKRNTLALLLGLVLAFGLTACGGETSAEGTGSEQETDYSLSVKFGTVTSISPLAENAELVSITIDDGVTAVDQERAVYVSAVDYIFTYASDDLEELSAFGFDENGDKIIAFTMPPELVSALRDIEAEGTWGTQGFSAWFGINDDAYDILVSGSVINE